MNQHAELTDQESAIRHIAHLVDACEQYADEQKPARDKALEYYRGVMNDIKGLQDRSQAVSMDVRAVVKKLMPSIMRTILSNDMIVEYEPVGPGDEEGAAQATDYVNHVVVPESGAEQAIYDAVFDALVIKTGILKWVAYHRKESKVYELTNQPSEALLGLIGEEDIEILEEETYPETEEEILAVDPSAQRHDVKLKRIEERVDIRLEAVPRGSFLIHPGSNSIEESLVVGERQIVSRSELISRGFDRDSVESISVYDSNGDDHEDGLSRGGYDYSDIDPHTVKAAEEVLVYEVYVKLDMDDDGIAELYKVCFAECGEDKEGHHVILEMEEVSEAPYSEVLAERQAHQFEGRSIAEDVVDIQKKKTALLRQTLDNIYFQNNMQIAIDADKLTHEGSEAVRNPKFNNVIELRRGARIEEAIQHMPTPYIADKALGMMDYLDNEIRERTGINDQSGGLDPEAFQNMTATSAQLMSESGIAQSEMIIRSLARGGIKKAFKGLLKLVVAHVDQPRTVRLRGKWVDYDPRHWNIDMDCTVNVGLGAGSKERDLAVLQMVLNLQKELLATMGMDNPYVKPDQLYNVLSKITETAGFPNADPYFTQPDNQEIADKLQQAQGPSEFEQKMKLEEFKAQVDAEKQKRNEENQAKYNTLERLNHREIQREQDAEKTNLELEKMRHQREMHAIETAAKMRIEAYKMNGDGEGLDALADNMHTDEEGNLTQAVIDMKSNSPTYLMEQMRQQMMEFQQSQLAINNANAEANANQMALMQQMAKSMERLAAPKRLIRDENGNPVGAEPILSDD